MKSVTVSKKKVEETNGMVVLPVKEYQRLLAAAIPHYYLTGKAARDLDKLVEEGMRDYRTGRTRTLKSLADLD